MSKDTTTDNITRPNFTPQELVVELIKGVVTRAPIEEIRNLIKLGADVNTAGNQSTKPLFHACLQNNRELITLLLDHGAEVNIANTGGGTPLHATCLTSNTEIATLLLDRGAEINIADRDGETPLYWACNNNKPKIIPLLLERGAEVNLSLLKAFIIRDEHNQIDAIINNPPDEPIQLHVGEYFRNTEILNLLHFPRKFDGTINLIGHDNNEIDLQFDAGADYLLK